MRAGIGTKKVILLTYSQGWCHLQNSENMVSEWSHHNLFTCKEPYPYSPPQKENKREHINLFLLPGFLQTYSNFFFAKRHSCSHGKSREFQITDERSRYQQTWVLVLFLHIANHSCLGAPCSSPFKGISTHAITRLKCRVTTRWFQEHFPFGEYKFWTLQRRKSNFPSTLLSSWLGSR